MPPHGSSKTGQPVSMPSKMAAAEKICQTRKLRLTPIRRRTLEILLTARRALGAYEILDILSGEGHGEAPPVVYRALDFLMKAGFVHRSERLNAYIACAHIGTSHTPALLICTVCHAAKEVDSAPCREPLEKTAASADFVLDRMVIEGFGLCADCRVTEHGR